MVVKGITQERLLTIEEAAEALGLKPPTIRKWVGQRRIGYHRLGRAFRISDAEIQRLLEAGSVPAAPKPRVSAGH
jgi:excisionase family DNA binding protein